MPFEKFIEFLNKRELKEELNAVANQFDKRRQAFNSWMNARNLENKQVEEMLKMAGYKDIPTFIADPDDSKYAKLKIPGQENYR